MVAFKSVMAAGFTALLLLTGCADSDALAGPGGGSAGTGGVGGLAGTGGSAGTGGPAGAGGSAPDPAQTAFLAFCAKLANCQPSPIPHVFEPLEPEVYFELCAASFTTLTRTTPCLEALAAFWDCVAEEEECDPPACDVHLLAVDRACRSAPPPPL